MRPITIATVSFLMEDTPHNAQLNLDRAADYIRDARRAGAQIVCLPETVTTNGVAGDAPIDPDWSKFFISAAIENSIAIIAPYYVNEEKRIFNQASVFDPLGNLKGYYRKAQPTGSEAKRITPGDQFPILDLGFAKIGIMICMDIYFPEIARIYAMKGAELLFWPTTTHGPTQSGLEAQLRSRAIDNSIHIIESNLACNPPYAPYNGHFYPGNARIVDFNGDILAQTGRRGGIAVATIDLDEKRTTSNVVLIHDPDDTRRDLEALARMDLYSTEYQKIADRQQRYYDTIEH